MSDESGWWSRLKSLASILPPVTLMTATLLWYGYVATRARFWYFGVDLDLAGLSNQQLLLYGVETIYPVLVLALIACFATLLAHAVIQWRLHTSRYRQLRTVAVLAAVVGVLLLGRALVGMLRPAIAATETPGVTPLSLTLGTPLIVYALWLVRRIALRAAGDPPEGWWADRRTAGVERAMIVVAVCVLGAGLMWAANSFAGAYGIGRAQQDAAALSRRPELVLFTVEPLPAVPADVAHIDHGDGVKFRHEYRGLRVLLEADGRLFLVPATWSAAASTVIVPYDAEIRVQLLPPYL